VKFQPEKERRMKLVEAMARNPRKVTRLGAIHIGRSATNHSQKIFRRESRGVPVPEWYFQLASREHCSLVKTQFVAFFNNNFIFLLLWEVGMGISDCVKREIVQH